MKKVILAAIIAFTSMAASAQVWMGGSLGLNFTKPDGGEMVTHSMTNGTLLSHWMSLWQSLTELLQIQSQLNLMHVTHLQKQASFHSLLTVVLASAQLKLQSAKTMKR